MTAAVAVTCFPAIATRTWRGTNANRTLTVEPREATAAFFVAANGAPQWVFQHHDDRASGTVPDAVASVAFGGPASNSVAINATTKETVPRPPEEGVWPPKKKSPLFGET